MPTARTLRWILTALLLTTTAACGGRQSGPVGGEDLLTGGEAASMMGEDEALALGLLEDMTVVLSSNADDPEQAVERMEAFVRVNRDAMRSSADAMVARRAAMTSTQARRYEAQLAAYLDDANTDWRRALTSFEREHPNAARGIRQLVAAVDD